MIKLSYLCNKQGYKTNYTKIKVKNIKPFGNYTTGLYNPAGDYFYVTVMKITLRKYRRRR